MGSFGPNQQVTDLDAQSGRNRCKTPERKIPLASLDRANIRTVKSTQMSELFLAPAPFPS